MLKQEIIETYQEQMCDCEDTKKNRAVIIRSLSVVEDLFPIEDLTREDLDVLPQEHADDVWNMYQVALSSKHRKLAQYRAEWILTAIIGKSQGYSDATKFYSPAKKEGKRRFSYKKSKCFTLREPLTARIDEEAKRLGLSFSGFAQRLFCAYFGVKELSDGRIVPVEDDEDYEYFPEPKKEP